MGVNIYKHFRGSMSNQCGTWNISNTPYDAKHSFWLGAWILIIDALCSDR